MITCKCGRENEDHYKFCLGCGAPLAAKPAEPAPAASTNCTQCGSALTPGQRFCVSCGYAVSSVTVNAGTAAPTEATAQSPNVVTDTQSSIEPDQVAEPTEAPQAQPEPAVSDEQPPAAQAPPEPAAASAEAGRLVMINPDRTIGGIFILKSGENLVGRECGHEVFTRDEYLSPEHAIFDVNGDKVKVRDLGSVNGIYYRATEIVELKSGDTIRIGKGVFVFETTENFRKLIDVNDDGTALFAGRPTNIWGRLARISGPVGLSTASNAWGFSQEEIVIGRERGDVTLNDDNYVSATHARIFRHEGRTFLEDLQSSNGTYLRIHESRDLANGANLLIGDQPFRLQLPE